MNASMSAAFYAHIRPKYISELDNLFLLDS